MLENGKAIKTSEESVLLCGIYKNYETIIEIKRFRETQHPESFCSVMNHTARLLLSPWFPPLYTLHKVQERTHKATARCTFYFKSPQVHVGKIICFRTKVI